MVWPGGRKGTAGMTIGTKKKKLSVNTYDSMNGPWGHYAKRSKPVTETNTVWFTLASYFSSVQFSSVAQSCPTLCDPMNRSTPGLPVHHQVPEFTQTHVHLVGDAIQPSHPLSSPSPPAPNPSQHQGLFQWVLFPWGGPTIGVSALASVLPIGTFNYKW